MKSRLGLSFERNGVTITGRVLIAEGGCAGGDAGNAQCKRRFEVDNGMEGDESSSSM